MWMNNPFDGMGYMYRMYAFTWVIVRWVGFIGLTRPEERKKRPRPKVGLGVQMLSWRCSQRFEDLIFDYKQGYSLGI